MNIKENNSYKQLKEAMDAIAELKIPEHLQQTALDHLLQGPVEIPHSPGAPTGVRKVDIGDGGDVASLREFMSGVNVSTAQIPALLFWAREHQGTQEVDSNIILSLYRKADVKPPKDIKQAMRDLSSKKKYGRLEAVKDKPGFVRLSDIGETFVLHDLRSKA